MNALEQMGEAVAGAQDAMLEARSDLEQARRRLLAGDRAIGPRGKVRSRRWWAALATAGLAALLLGLWLGRPANEPLHFEIADTGKPGTVRAWITAPPMRQIPLRFSDGSSVLLGNDSRVRVQELTAAGATVQLERGRVSVAVVRRPGARWSFHVGPFDVTVTGTRFDASWQAARQVFGLAMHDGSVRLQGPTVEAGRALVAGQRLRIDLRSGHTTAGSTQGGMPSGALEVGEAPQASGQPVGSVVRPGASAPTGTGARATDGGAEQANDWQRLAHEGKYRDAFAAAKPHFDAICASAPAAEIMTLGDAALYAGDAGRARRAYRVIRRRFAGSGPAALAAFKLGRLAWSGHGGQAIGWLLTYLQEAPSGPLAREALGRIMEAQSRQGRTAAAKSTARRYLASYPGGPHAKLAKQLLGR